MKIEPIRHAKTPKYLAALAIAASAAGMLTGCTTAGEVEVMGVAPMPVGGYTEPAVTEPADTALQTEGNLVVTDDTACTTVQTNSLELEGDVAVLEPDCTDSTCTEAVP